MNWNMDVQYVNANYPYNISGSFMEYFEGLTYDHVNFIFSGASHGQESLYPSENTNYYKFGLLESGSYFYYDDGQDYEVNSHGGHHFEYRRAPISSRMAADDQNATTASSGWDGNANAASSHASSAVCPRRHQNLNDYQVIWQDNIDPDSMTYEELRDLGEAVGTHSRGLSKELISLLPVSKYKFGFFLRRKSRHERCVICQMEYRRGEHQMTLPCKHVYHAGCSSRWLSINKACPICYTDVSVVAPPTQSKKK